MCSTLWQWTRHSGPDVTKEENIQKTLQPGIQEPQFSRSDFGQVANPLELCFPINQHLDLEWPFRTPRIPSELPEERWFQHTSTPKISISKLKFIFYLLPYCWLACSWCNLFRLSHAERFGTEFAWITVHKIKLSGFHCTRRTCVQTRQEAAGFSRLFQTPVRIASPLIQHSPVFIVHCYNSLPPKLKVKRWSNFSRRSFYIAVQVPYLARKTGIDFPYFIRVDKYQIHLQFSRPTNFYWVLYEVILR